MATTALFVEILIVGLETTAWLCLVVLLFTGPLTVNPKDYTDWASLITVVVLAIAYVLGTVVDRLADSAYDWFWRTKSGGWLGRYVRKSLPRIKPKRITRMRLTVMKESDGIAKFIDYQRSRVRIARGTLFNLVLALPVAIAYLLVWRREPMWISAVAVLGIILTAATLLAAERIHQANLKRLRDAYRLVRSGAEKEA
jgi:hypothetical protein